MNSEEREDLNNEAKDEQGPRDAQLAFYLMTFPFNLISRGANAQCRALCEPSHLL
jgi:hypothetical protein